MDMDFKNEVLNAIDKKKFFEEFVEIKNKVGNGDEVQALCPFHEDSVASLSINLTSGLYFCHSCQSKGDLINFYQTIKKIDFLTALKELAARVGKKLPDKKPKKVIDKNIAINFHNILMESAQLEPLMIQRGFTKETIVKYQLGWDAKTGRYTIPVFDEGGDLVNIRRYKMGAKQYKMISWTDENDDGKKSSYGDAKIFNIDILKNNKEIIFGEGESDTMIATQYGFNAITVTSGAGTFFQQWIKLFKDKIVYLCFDNDLAGINGNKRVASMIASICEKVYILEWPNFIGEKGDITDYFVRLGHTAEEFRELLNQAKEYKDIINVPEMEAQEVTLSESSFGYLCGKKVAIKVMVSGKDTAPYIIPGKFKVWCDQGNNRMCSTCGLHDGQKVFDLTPKNPEILELINVPKENQLTAIKKLAGVHKCTRVNVETEESINIEEIKVIPQLTFSTSDNEYVTRMSYYIGYGLKTNSNYKITGYVWPEPKKAYATLIFKDAEAAQDNIDLFKVTPEIREKLKIFQTKDIKEKIDEIYSDLVTNVIKIWQREEFLFGIDLIYHSVLSFYFQKEMVNKGWITALAIGDSSQGKSHVTTRLINHYCLGDRITGENTTEAGLIGALSQIQNHWIIGWGKIPLNDRRLLVIDEFSGISKEIIGKLSDLISTGIATITKVMSEQTYARTRILMMANPREGRQLNTYTTAIDAIKSLIHKNEDIRRLDFALILSSDEVPVSVLNRDSSEIESVKHVYNTDLCRNLILWAWSRKPEQVIILPETEREILKQAKFFSGKYSSQVPLVEPADQRLKLARMSVALAARLYSCDDSGENIIVKPEHTIYISNWLDKAYSKSSFSYDVFSTNARKGSVLSDHEKSKLMLRFKEFPGYEQLIVLLQDTNQLKKQDIQDQMKYSKDEVSDLWQFLSINFLIKQHSHGYYKNPVFVSLLKDMTKVMNNENIYSTIV